MHDRNEARLHGAGPSNRNTQEARWTFVRALLEEAEANRRRQLELLPADARDVVALAHRASVERILRDVIAARERLAEGTYGTCLECGVAMAPGELELRLWEASCARCA